MINKALLTYLLFACVLFYSCGHKADQGASHASKVKFEQYYVNGKRLYVDHCSNCHQEDGSGLARLYPPLKNSDYFNSDPDRTLCIIRFGQEGEIVVDGISYNQPMPANPDLTPLELAELMTYLYSTWGDDAGIYTIDDISAMIDACGINEDAR